MHHKNTRLYAQLNDYYDVTDKQTVCIKDQDISFYPILHLLEYIPTSPDFTRLPPLFDSSENFPIANMYVELSVAQSGGHINPHRISRGLTLAEEIHARYKEQKARRVSIQTCLDIPQHNKIVILGDPGCGKTSLLKYLCLDIAQGNNTRWYIPIMVSLRLYWIKKQQDPSLTLLQYAATLIKEYQSQDTHQENSQVDHIEILLKSLSGPNKDNVIFLLDGFDEIATHKSAVNLVTEEIKTLNTSFSWILTSRYTGFYGGLGENIRYEVLPLNKVGIEELVTSWFENSGGQSDAQLANTVLKQIYTNNHLKDMAANPFLLTLLCYLQKSHANKLLPLYRSDVYEDVIKLIRQQLRTKEKNQKLFRKKEYNYLINFCHYLYTDVPNAPLQVFEYDHWDEFPYNKKTPDFEKHFLPSRLINRWRHDGDFYFTHLTFQEYLIAAYLSKLEFKHVQAHLFSPHWKLIYRFLAGIYGKDKDLKRLTQLVSLLLNPVDKTGILYIEAAHLLIEANVEDSTQMLGYDLRGKLLEICFNQSDYANQSAKEALALLSPNFVLKKAIQSIYAYSEEKDSQTTPYFTLLKYIDTPDTDDIAIQLLASDIKAMKKVAIDIIATKNTRYLREAVITLYKENKQLGFDVLCTVAKETKHKVFIPYLAEYLKKPAKYLDDYSELFCALTAIGDSSQDENLLSFAKHYDLDDLTDDLIEAILSLGTLKVKNWLSDTLRAGDNESLGAVVFYAIDLGLLQTKEIIRFLQTTDIDAQSYYLTAVLYQIQKGILPNTDIIQTIINIAFSVSANKVRALGIIQHLDLTTIFDDELLVQFKIECRRYIHSSDMEMAIAAIDILSELQDLQSYEKIKKLALSGHIYGIRPVAILALPHFKYTHLEDVKSTLHSQYEIAIKEKNYLDRDILDSLARVDLSEIIQYLDNPDAIESMMRFSAMEGVLIFDDYYIDKFGTKHLYSKALPVPILDPNLQADEQLETLRDACHFALDHEKIRLTSAKRNSNPLPLFTKIESGVNANDFENGINIQTGKKFLKGKHISSKSANMIMRRLLAITGDLFID